GCGSEAALPGPNTENLTQKEKIYFRWSANLLSGGTDKETSELHLRADQPVATNQLTAPILIKFNDDFIHFLAFDEYGRVSSDSKDRDSYQIVINPWGAKAPCD